MLINITEDTMLMELIQIDDGIADILMEMGMHCLGCALAHGETLGQAAAVHGIAPQVMVDKVNAYLASKQK